MDSSNIHQILRSHVWCHGKLIVSKQALLYNIDEHFTSKIYDPKKGMNLTKFLTKAIVRVSKVEEMEDLLMKEDADMPNISTRIAYKKISMAKSLPQQPPKTLVQTSSKTVTCLMKKQNLQTIEISTY
jgi:hypothetical protein